MNYKNLPIITSKNNFYTQVIGLFFILSFFSLTFKTNIYIFIPLFLLSIIFLSSFSYKIAYLLIVFMIGLMYLVVFEFGEFYRFEKTLLLAVPITYILLKYPPQVSKSLKYFINISVFLIYLEFIFYNIFGMTLMPNTTVTLNWPRYHALFEDSNFYSYTILIYLIFNKIQYNKYNFFYIGSILISLSISAITIMIILLLSLNSYKKNISKIKNIRVYVFYLITLVMTLYYIVALNTSNIIDLSDNKVVQWKLHSMSLRFDVQSQAIDKIIENDTVLLGMGSGYARKMNERGMNLHNTYLQTFLEIGLIGLLVIIVFFFVIYVNINILFLPLLASFFLLGNVLEVFYFPLLLFIFFLSKVYDNYLISKVKK